MEVVVITKQHRLYHEIDSLIIVLQSLAVSIEYYSLGKVDYLPGEYLSYTGRATGKMVRFPLYGPIQAVINNIKPFQIELTIEDIRKSEIKNPRSTGALVNTLNFIFSPYIVSYYERNIEAARAAFGTNYDTWPEAWRMGWVVRNALSHDGRIFYKNKRTPGLVWRNVSISPENQGQELIGNFVNFSDLTVLLFDMDSCLPDIEA